MKEPLRTIILGNGLVVRFFDRTGHYYGGFFHVAVVAECTVELRPEHFSSDLEFHDAVSHLGDTVTYEQRLERMGVRSEEVGKVRDILIERFLESARGYLTSPEFPSRLAISETMKLHKSSKVSRPRFAR